MSKSPASSAAPPPAACADVPFQRVSAFVRQVTHDVRNNLNAMDLQAAFALELAGDPEVTEELKRLRGQIQLSAKALQSLSANFWLAQPSLVSYSANIFVEDFRDRLARTHPENASSVHWTSDLADETISIDIEMIFAGLSEVFRNTFQFAEAGGTVAVRVFAEGGRFVLELTESRSAVPSPPESWGVEPFVSSRRGAYGLGLFRSRMILALHGGDLSFSHDSGRALLTTRITLPAAATHEFSGSP